MQNTFILREWHKSFHSTTHYVSCYCKYTCSILSEHLYILSDWSVLLLPFYFSLLASWFLNIVTDRGHVKQNWHMLYIDKPSFSKSQQAWMIFIFIPVSVLSIKASYWLTWENSPLSKHCWINTGWNMNVNPKFKPSPTHMLLTDLSN